MSLTRRNSFCGASSCYLCHRGTQVLNFERVPACFSWYRYRCGIRPPHRIVFVKKSYGMVHSRPSFHTIRSLTSKLGIRLFRLEKFPLLDELTENISTSGDLLINPKLPTDGKTRNSWYLYSCIAPTTLFCWADMPMSSSQFWATSHR